MKRKGNLSEELYKMRKLMSFNSEKFRDETTSLDRLVEEKMMEKYLLNEQYKMDDYPDNQREFMRKAKERFFHYFMVLPKDNVVKADVGDINALFYNNMVTLEKGLMPDTPIDSVRQQIENTVKNLKEKGYDEKSLKINIIGTASSAAASKFGDERLGKEIPVDHRGADYGGEKPNNEYLAKERAKSIGGEFRKYLPNATYTTTSKVLEGGAGAEGDTVRFIKLDITGSKTIKDQVTTSDSYLNFKYTYKEGEGYTTMEALQQQKGEELTNQQGAVFSGGPFKTYTAKLEISFGSKRPSYGGKYVKVSADLDPGGAGVESKTVYKHSFITGQEETVRTMSILKNPNSWNQSPTKTLGAPNKLRDFLISSGHFTADQVQTILAGFKDPNSSVLDKLKDKEGNFKDFVSLMGGKSEQTIDSDYAKYAIVDDTVTRKIKQIR